MAITASMVKELREMTGAGMMDCKKALNETNGDMDAAVEFLRKNGQAKAEKKASRIAAEGVARAAISADGKTACVIEVNSETDFVAKNEEFIEFVEDLAKEVLAKGNMPMEQFMAEPFGEGTVQETLTAKVAKIGENLSIRRFAKVEEDGVVYVGYTHGGGRIGVIVGIKTDAAADEIAAVGKDVAMQVASMNPKFVNEDGVDPEYLENEKKILTEQVLNEGKKPEMVERIVAGKIKKELKEVCLLDQPFVKDGDVSVQQYVANAAKEIGKDMEVVSMIRYEVGEGIEKKEDDFAAEVAAQVAGN